MEGGREKENRERENKVTEQTMRSDEERENKKAREGRGKDKGSTTIITHCTHMLYINIY